MKLPLQLKKTSLSSSGSAFKTENFLTKASAFLGLDFLLCKIYEGILNERTKFQDGLYDVKLKDCEFVFALGRSIFASCNPQKNDAVFFELRCPDAFVRKGDRRFLELLGQEKTEFEVEVDKAKSPSFNELDFVKLYRVTETDAVRVPRLSDTQTKIVTTEDQNMLVQGVAGSGKTNLCMDKILHTASRNYAHKVLYSTFSRGLLYDTKTKVMSLTGEIKRLIRGIEEKAVIFLDNNHVKCVENRLGIFLDTSNEKLLYTLQTMVNYLENKVDYLLLEDLYKEYVTEEYSLADESYFALQYTQNIKNHQLASRLQKVKHLSFEVLYKEIFGLISGACDPQTPHKILTRQSYAALRKDAFNNEEIDTIYAVALDYFAHLEKNALTDYNIMSRQLLDKADKIPKYSLTILDEVQDYTEVNLNLFYRLSRKMFCVGDALQMINASYFSFAYLKRLLYEKDLSSVAELQSNYRNSKHIALIAENLSKLNTKLFGVHRFVLKVESVDNSPDSETVYIDKGDILEQLKSQPFSNYTVVVSSKKEKEKLRQKYPAPEILTVAEIKGLERDTIILYDLVSSNHHRWKRFARVGVNRKTADENSVYRYDFNLLYVGVSRAKTRLYVQERDSVEIFEKFFEDNFEPLPCSAAAKKLLSKVDKLEAEQDEILSRIKQFIQSAQYDNARQAANRILTIEEREKEIARIDIFENFVHKGKHKEAGIKFLQSSLYTDAKEQFQLCAEEGLAALCDSCMGETTGGGLEALSAFIDAGENEDIQKVIVGLVREDLKQMQNTFKSTSEKFQIMSKGRRKHG